MKTGEFIFLQLVALTLLWRCEAGGERSLLKVPRIYNVLLSSNEMLVPSQAYPVISPVLQPVSSVYVSDRSSYETKHDSPLETRKLPALESKPEVPRLEPALPRNIKNHKPLNPDIPDVPPPPLPVTIREQQQQKRA